MAFPSAPGLPAETRSALKDSFRRTRRGSASVCCGGCRSGHCDARRRLSVRAQHQRVRVVSGSAWIPSANVIQGHGIATSQFVQIHRIDCRHELQEGIAGSHLKLRCSATFRWRHQFRCEFTLNIEGCRTRLRCQAPQVCKMRVKRSHEAASAILMPKHCLGCPAARAPADNASGKSGRKILGKDCYAGAPSLSHILRIVWSSTTAIRCARLSAAPTAAYVTYPSA